MLSTIENHAKSLGNFCRLQAMAPSCSVAHVDRAKSLVVTCRGFGFLLVEFLGCVLVREYIWAILGFF